MIPNPAYFEDSDPYKMTPIVSAVTIYDDVFWSWSVFVCGSVSKHSAVFDCELFTYPFFNVMNMPCSSCYLVLFDNSSSSSAFHKVFYTTY